MPPRKRQKFRDAFFEDEEIESEEEVLAEDDDDDENESDEDVVQETAEEKRQRLAQEYLAKMKDVVEGDEEESDDEPVEEDSDEEDIFLDEDSVGRKLKHDLLAQEGRRKLEVAKYLDSTFNSSSSLTIRRGHKLSPTCVCLSSDDKTAFTASKDKAWISWDVETGQKSVRSTDERGCLLCICVSYDGNRVVVAGDDGVLRVYDPRTRSLVGLLKSHRKRVTGVAFREGSHDLYSSSVDRTVKVWDVREMAFVDTLHGHVADVLGIDALSSERCITSSRDKTVRLWKVVEESQLVFKGPGSSVEAVCMLSDDRFIAGCQDGSMHMWSVSKRKPLSSLQTAHNNWISSVCCLPHSDLAASGSDDGMIQMYQVGDKTLDKSVVIPVSGFVNGIQISRKGEFVVAAVGQEHRLGRWFSHKGVRNGLAVAKLENKTL